MTRHDLERHPRSLKRQDFQIRKTRSGHWRISKPGSIRIVITGSTPSDYRAAANFQANLRRVFGADG